jgi:beta-galactosidase
MRWLGVIGLATIVALTGQSAMATTTQAAPARTIEDLDAGWRFIRQDVANASDVRFDDHAWPRVRLPHTWNATDGDDGGTCYRGAGWYRRNLDVPPEAGGRRHYLEFDGAALAADLWINGVHVGRHDGGYARFRFDITPWLKTGRNVVAVRVDNSQLPDVAPLSGDFTIFGGIDRDVRLVTTAAVHVDMLDYGSSGVRFRQDEVSAQGAHLGWTARIANDEDQPAAVTVTVHLTDAAHHEVAGVTQTATVAAHAVTPVDLMATLSAPHLWQGIADPYLYTSTIEVRTGRRLVDSQTFQVGLRDIRFDAARGLILNGKPYGVHGVDVHQVMRPGQGPAVTPAEVDADFRTLQDLGVTGLRFAHYQHPPREYDLADRMGLLVWTEVPNVGDLGPSDGFAANAVQQMRELVRQNENHPSVMVWGIGNELHRAGDKTFSLLDKIAAVAHEEDPSRPTTYANCCGPIDQAQASHSDLVGANVYFGWYTGDFADLTPWYQASVKRIPDKPLAISEYGAGASGLEQEDPPRRPTTTSSWHPEQYQALYHEAAWRQLRDLPLWGTFVWAGFDFPSDGRNEGDHAGINDKGLVSYDRRIRKDAYFWYQANWTMAPMVYITSRRYVVRAAAGADIKIYSNQPSVSLRLNGADLGAHAVVDHIATWHVDLVPGRNRVEATTTGASDAVDWIYQPPQGGH